MNNLPAPTHYRHVVRQDDGALAEGYRPNCHQQTCVEDAYDGCVYNENDVELKARSHCGDK